MHISIKHYSKLKAVKRDSFCELLQTFLGRLFSLVKGTGSNWPFFGQENKVNQHIDIIYAWMIKAVHSNRYTYLYTECAVKIYEAIQFRSCLKWLHFHNIEVLIVHLTFSCKYTFNICCFSKDEISSNIENCVI